MSGEVREEEEDSVLAQRPTIEVLGAKGWTVDPKYTYVRGGVFCVEGEDNDEGEGWGDGEGDGGIKEPFFPVYSSR